MGFDRNLQPIDQPRWTVQMEQDRHREQARRREQERPPKKPIEPRVDPNADTDPAMPDGTTPLERDQRPINQSR